MFKKSIYIVILLIVLISLNTRVFAENKLENTINKLIYESEFNKTTIVAVSIRDIKSGSLVYDRHGDLLLHPASLIKAITTPVIIKYLGENYMLVTELYKSVDNGNIYLKLSGDPFLTTDDLVDLFKKLSDLGINEIKQDIVIDNKCLDDIPYGIGWMWDDNNSSFIPKYSAFNLDHNTVSIKISPNNLSLPPTVSIIPQSYKVNIINSSISSSEDDLFVGKQVWKDPENIYVSGKVSKLTDINIPVGMPQNYFVSQLRYAINSNKISFKGNIIIDKLPNNVILLSSIDHDLLSIINHLNKFSNNLEAETLFKIAGGVYTNSIGTTENGVKALNYFYNQLSIPASDQLIVDASGVSHNNLVQPNWVTLVFTKLYSQPIYDVFLNSLAKPASEGTLLNRLYTLKANFNGKTGTLSGVSTIGGYLKAESGNVYAVVIMIQNYKNKSEKAKELENKIIEVISKLL